MKHCRKYPCLWGCSAGSSHWLQTAQPVSYRGTRGWKDLRLIMRLSGASWREGPCGWIADVWLGALGLEQPMRTEFAGTCLLDAKGETEGTYCYTTGWWICWRHLEQLELWQSSPSTGDFVIFKLNPEMTWPINFKLLSLTLHRSPRLALRLWVQAIGGCTSRSGAFQKEKMPGKGFPPALRARAREVLKAAARQRCRERTVHEGKVCFLHQKAVLQA